MSTEASKAPAQQGPDAEQKPQWAGVATLALATLAVASEMTFAAFALPLVATEFDVSSGATAWVLLAYSIPLAALAIAVGRWADRSDPRTIYFLSVGGVGLANLLAALSPSFGFLLGVRALQGVTAAMYLAVYLTLITLVVPPHMRGRAMSYITGIMLLGNIAVAPLGGWIASTFGWREVFLIKLPLIGAILWLGYYKLPRPAPRPAGQPRLALPSGSMCTETLIAGSAITLLMLSFEYLGKQPLLALALTGLAIAVAAIWLRLPTTQPLRGLLGNRRILYPLIGLTLLSSTVGLMVFLLPFFIAEVLGRSPNVLGIAMVFFILPASALSPIAGWLVDRYGAVAVARRGSLVILLGMLSMLTLNTATGLLGLLWPMALMGAGLALFNSPAQTAVLKAVPYAETGTAGGLISLFRTLGHSLGPAMAALAWNLVETPLPAFQAGTLALTICSLGGFIALWLAPLPKRH